MYGKLQFAFTSFVTHAFPSNSEGDKLKLVVHYCASFAQRNPVLP